MELFGAEIELTYLPHEEFSGLVSANDPEALNHFSFDPDKQLIYYAVYTETVVTVNGVETSRVFTLREESASYKAVVSMCSMPYNFLFALLQESSNPEWVMAVIDLLLEKTDVIFMIQDQLSITAVTETTDRATKTDVTSVAADGTSSTSSSVEYPAAGSTVVTVTTTYTNTANVFIKKAYTWCMDFEQEALGPNLAETSNETTYDYPDPGSLCTNLVSSTTSTPAEDGSYTVTTVYSSDDLLESVKVETKNYTWTIQLVKKEINTKLFLGTWKNDTGKYYLGSEYKADGKEIKYKLPDATRETGIPPKQLSDSSEQNIDIVISLLSKHENTQLHEQLMMYFWNVYVGKNVYDVSLEEILDLFNTTIFTPTSGTSSSSLLELIRKQLAYWEGTGTITTNGEGKQCYVAYWDSYGQVVTIGHGVTTHKLDYFKDYGITSISTGDLIEVEIVDAIEELIIKDTLNSVQSTITGLKDYQYAALTIAYYNCPALVSAFPGKYNTYWKDSDDKYGEPLPYKPGIISDSSAESTTITLKNYVNCDLYSNGWADYCHSGGKALGGLVRRRYYEWMLFQYGYDVVSDSYYKSGDFYSGDGEVDSNDMLALQQQLAAYVGLESQASGMTLDLSSQITGLNSKVYWDKVLSIGSKWYGTSKNLYTASRNNSTNTLIFQCTWWAYGRASQYLEETYGYPNGLPTTFNGNGGTFYSRNLQGGYFNYGSTPKPHSIISWNKSGEAGHVAFVEAVDSNYIYISHAGSGVRWYGISRIPISGHVWSGYSLNGYVYLDEPKNINL